MVRLHKCHVAFFIFLFLLQPIYLSTTADDMDRITIENGMNDIASGTCIKFIHRTHEASFLDIQPRYGWVHCWLLSALNMDCRCMLGFFSRCNFTFWWWHIISVPRHKLLVISGADWRKPDPVAADSWVHVVGGGCPWVNACPRLRTWAVSLRPRPVRHDYVEKHHARSGWKSNSMDPAARAKAFLLKLILLEYN